MLMPVNLSQARFCWWRQTINKLCRLIPKFVTEISWYCTFSCKKSFLRCCKYLICKIWFNSYPHDWYLKCNCGTIRHWGVNDKILIILLHFMHSVHGFPKPYKLLNLCTAFWIKEPDFKQQLSILWLILWQCRLDFKKINRLITFF